VATINDVAARAGVSRTTTSRVLNNRPKVDAETRRRVQRAIQELGYVPSPTARRLSLGRTWTVDVVASYLTRPQAIERLRGAESVLGDTGFDLVVRNVETPERRERYLRELPAANRTDGVLLVSLPPTSDNLRRLAVGPVPVVVIDVHGQAVEGLPVVRGDDVAGGAIAGRYLFTLGHRAIGFVADSFDNPYGFTSSRDRYAGFTDVLRELGIEVEAALGAHGSRSARDLALRLLTGRRPPTAIFAASDTQALGVMSAARDLGLQVPADLTVVGYDDIPIAEPIGLTTIRQHLFESGRIGAELLLAEIEQRSAVPPLVSLEPELVVRATSAPPKEGRA
jgi:DNA-binding LacI/PurR family transcriptional regulator